MSMNSIHAIDSQRIPLPNKAKGLQNQKHMKITAIALLTLGALGVLLGVAALTAGGFGIAMGGLPSVGLIAIGVGLSMASMTSIALGIFFLKRPYWKDQAYVDQQAAKATGMSFDQIVKTFGWKWIQTQQLISYPALKKKFLERIESLDYRTIVREYGNAIQQQTFISWKDLKDKLTHEAQAMTAKTFRQTYGDQPLNKGVIDANDAWYQQMILAEIHQEKLSIEQILQRHGWLIFELNIIQGNAFREQFLKEIKNDSLLQIINTYGWKILDHHLALPADLHSFALKACEEVQTFEELVNQLSDRVFSSKILTSQDQVVRDKVKSLCERMT